MIPPEESPKEVPFVLPNQNGQMVNPTVPMYNGNCWKRAYSRGVGKPLHACPDGYEKQGLFCYQICQEGYKGVLADC